VFEKIVLVTRKTRLAELVERFNSRGQAKFYIEHSGGDFSDYEQEDDAYRRSLATLRRSLDVGLKLHVLDRDLVPTCVFSAADLIVTIGQDGLVANTAKYVGGQPLIAVNPDPSRFEGILLGFSPEEARSAVERVLAGRASFRNATLALVTLGDGQRLLAFNDVFIGARSHVSARYRISFSGSSEIQSSSGVLVSTGAGSTGWLSSVFNMAEGISKFSGGGVFPRPSMAWEDPRLIFVVREPYASRHSRADLVTGILEARGELVIESLMPSGGVIFSDGMESDHLDFNSGARALVRAAPVKAHLVTAESA
jgi:NAD kinase